MRYVAAYLLAALGGKENPAAADIEKILSSVGIEVDKEKLTKVINELKGKNIAQLMEKGEKCFHLIYMYIHVLFPWWLN